MTQQVMKNNLSAEVSPTLDEAVTLSKGAKKMSKKSKVAVPETRQSNKTQSDPYEIARQEGFDEGYKKGYAEGGDRGFDTGLYVGDENGYGKGHNDGYCEGLKVGRIEGLAKGYEEGRSYVRESNHHDKIYYRQTYLNLLESVFDEDEDENED